MNDRELIELAAKAAGLKPSGLWRGGMMEIEGPDSTEFLGDHRYWNPLVNDGDALRLAVKLWLEVTLIPNEYGQAPFVRAGRIDRDTDRLIEAFEDITDDAMSATRLAIVRAAAAIARKSDE